MHSATWNACAYQHHCNIALIPTKLLPSHKHKEAELDMENPFIHGNKSPNILPTSSVWLLEAAHRRCACTMSPLFSVQLRCSFQLPFQSLWWPVPSVTIQKTVDSISASCFVPGFHAGVWFPAYAQKAVVLDKCFQQQSAVLWSFICLCWLLLVLFAFFSLHVLLHHYHFAHLLCLCIQQFDL